MRRAMKASVVLVVGAVALTGCGTDGDDMSTDDGHRADDRQTMPTNEAGMGSGAMESHEESSPVAADARRIEVQARSFEFEPKEIRAAAGENLAVELTSEDIEHDFEIGELDAHVAAEGGETAVGGFSAGESGRYTFWCTVPGHREAGMEGILIVE